MKKLSIVIPVYNDKKVKRAIDSIVESPDIEIIVVDGGSKKEVLDILNAQIDKIDCFVSEPDKGLYDAMNKGVKMSSGEWILTLAADDQLICNPLKIIDKYESMNPDLICGTLVAKDFNERFFIIESECDLKRLEEECSIHHPGVFFRKTVYENCGEYDLNYKCAADRDFFMRCFVNKLKFLVINEFITYFEYGGTSTVNPMRAFKEDVRISDKYNISFFKTRFVFVKRIVKVYGSKIKDMFGIKHNTNYMSKVQLVELLKKHPEVYVERFQ